jgi:hypothetical protein
MPQIVAQACKLDAFNVAVCDFQTWLASLQVLRHQTRQMGDPCDGGENR